MEYILITIAMLIAGACVLAIFAESEILKSSVIYEKGQFSYLKIIKYKENKIVSQKVYRGKKADFIYRFFC